jgi:hypothetical protein
MAYKPNLPASARRHLEAADALYEQDKFVNTLICRTLISNRTHKQQTN